MTAIKVKEINLESGNPLVETALKRMVNELMTAKGAGYRAVILIHGYGSSGTGGKIKLAVRKKLQESSLRGVVRGYCGGETWVQVRKDYFDFCKQLKEYNDRIEGNNGVTVVLLR